MIPYKRRLQMLKLLETHEIVSVPELLEAMPDVSESTIRRDLKALEAEGQLVTMRGGGVSRKIGSYEVPVNSKAIVNVAEKERIASYAAGLVKDGEAIYLDSGSTTLRMLKHLKNKEITIVTSNALVLTELEDAAKVKCFMVGGEINFATASLYGMETVNELSRMNFDKAFIGANGFSQAAGISTHDILEAEKKRTVKRNCTETYVLMDSSKSGRNALHKVFDISEVTIICDREMDELVAGGNYLIAE